MGIDVNRIASAAVDSALDDGKHRRLTAPRAIAVGAGLAVAARYAAGKAPDLLPRRLKALNALSALPGVPDALRERLEPLRDRLTEHGWGESDEDWDDEELDEEEEYEEYDDDEPEAEADVPEPAAEDEPLEEPEDEPLDEGEDEPEAAANEDEPEAEEPDEEEPDEDEPEAAAEEDEPEAEDEDQDDEDQPAARRRGRSRRNAVDPVERPPAPPPDTEQDDAKAKAGSPKAKAGSR
jgi:hypothetical protein